MLSAIAHGSISLFGSLLLWLLFPDSTLATFLGITRLFIPIIIFLTTQDPLAKENAREASNYAIHNLVLGGVAIAGIIPMALVGTGLFTTSPGLLILLAISLVDYLCLLALAPLIATVYCCLNGGQAAHYPKWLTLHLI